MGGYFIYQKQIKPATIQQAVQPSPSPKKDEIVNWKTYTNAKYKFTLSYPQDLAIKESNLFNENHVNIDLRNKDGYLSIENSCRDTSYAKSTNLHKKTKLSIDGQDVDLYIFKIKNNVNFPDWLLEGKADFRLKNGLCVMIDIGLTIKDEGKDIELLFNKVLSTLKSE